MKDVIQGAVKLLENQQSCVIATVVKTNGSTPQKPGAKLLIREDGSGLGTLGGGCVEGDIWYAAKEILRNGSGPEFRDYFLNEDIAARDGLVCGGTMYFFIEPILSPTEYLPFGKEMIGAYSGGKPVSVATVVNGEPSVAIKGSRIMLREDGSTLGSLGKPELDKIALIAAEQVCALGTNQYVTTDDGIGIFIEGCTTPTTLILIGGGHVAKSTYQLARMMGYRVFVVDDRAEFANAERFPEAESTIVVDDYTKSFDTIPVNKNTFIIVATRGHWFDDLALEAAVKTQASYVGLLGSKRKTIMIYKRLNELGVSAERLKSVHAPIGLDIGALTPEELATSIISEIIMVRRGGAGMSMQMSDKYVHRALGMTETPPQPLT